MNIIERAFRKWLTYDSRSFMYDISVLKKRPNELLLCKTKMSPFTKDKPSVDSESASIFILVSATQAVGNKWIYCFEMSQSKVFFIATGMDWDGSLFWYLSWALGMLLCMIKAQCWWFLRSLSVNTYRKSR